MPRRATFFSLWLASSVFLSSCASRLSLPSGPGSPRADSAVIFSQATAACRDVSTMTAELTLSGRVGRQSLRGRVLAGLAANALRLEGVAPFGPPAFIFVVSGGEGSLLLPRDRRVLASAPPAEVLAALAGVAVSPDELRALLTGCVKPNPEVVAARGYGSEWVVVELAGGGVMYLRQRNAAWRVVAGTYLTLEIEYGEFADRYPLLVRLRAPTGPDRPAVDLQVRLRQVELNTAVDPAAFRLAVPPDALPVTLEDLRESGPLGDAR